MQFKCVENCSDCCIYREYYPDKRYGKVGVLLIPEEKEKVIPSQLEQEIKHISE